MTNRLPVSDLMRCLGAMLTWFGISLIAGLLGTFYGPGVPALISGLFLGFCGMTLHLLLWAVSCKLHRSYAGLVFGLITTFFLYAFNRTDSVDLMVVFILFLSFTVLSYAIYPLANYILNGSRRRVFE